MKKLESIIKKGKMIALASVASLAVGCASMVHYIEPEIGVKVPVAAEKQNYDALFSAGVDYGFYFQDIGLGLEAGIDYFHSSAKYIETDSLMPRVSVNFSPFEIFMPDGIVKPYITAGASFLNEFSTISIPEFGVNDAVKGSRVGIDLNLGATLFDRINLKLGYTFLPASENAKGIFSVTGGYRFLFEEKK
jgi:hypothetical protein